MSKHVKWLLVLCAGWVLGWHTHRHWSAQDISPSAELRPGSSLPGGAGRNSVRFGQEDQYVADKPGSPLSSVFEKMLSTGQYQQAMQLFNAPDSQSSREQYRVTLIQYLNTLLQVKDYLHADQILSAYLNEEYRDVDVLLLRARLYWLQGQHRQAIETLYDAKSYEYRAPQLALIAERIRTYVADHDRQLQIADEQLTRLALYEYLVQVEPDYSPYFIALARAQLAQNRLDEARQSLFLVESDPRVSDEARLLLSQIEDTVTFSQASQVSIPLIRQGEHFLIDARINDRVTVRLLIDTGASMTVLRDDILVAAGLFKPARPSLQLFSTANGLVEGAVYRLDNLSIGDQNVANIEVAALGLASLQSADGLLGMNFLKHFKFFIDQNKPELRLSGLTDTR
ncbi:MAG: TIGR02281 family clan AA aspartic protease [Thiogranum sp.]